MDRHTFRRPPKRRYLAARRRAAGRSSRLSAPDALLHLLGVVAHLLGDLEVTAELVEVARRVLRVRQYLPEPPIRLAPPPFSRIADRHLFMPHPVVPGGARDVQV